MCSKDFWSCIYLDFTNLNRYILRWPQQFKKIFSILLTMLSNIKTRLKNKETLENRHLECQAKEDKLVIWDDFVILVKHWRFKNVLKIEFNATLENFRFHCRIVGILNLLLFDLYACPQFFLSITWGDQIALDIILDKLNRFLYLGKLVFHEILDMLKIESLNPDFPLYVSLFIEMLN